MGHGVRGGLRPCTFEAVDWPHKRGGTLVCFLDKFDYFLYCCLFEAPNRLDLHTAPLDRKPLECYKARRKAFHIYKAAARLWSAGMNWQQSLEIVSDAFNAAVAETKQ